MGPLAAEGYVTAASAGAPQGAHGSAAWKGLPSVLHQNDQHDLFALMCHRHARERRFIRGCACPRGLSGLGMSPAPAGLDSTLQTSFPVGEPASPGCWHSLAGQALPGVTSCAETMSQAMDSPGRGGQGSFQGHLVPAAALSARGTNLLPFLSHLRGKDCLSLGHVPASRYGPKQPEHQSAICCPTTCTSPHWR